MTEAQRNIRDEFIKLTQEACEANLAGNYKLAQEINAKKEELLKAF